MNYNQAVAKLNEVANGANGYTVFSVMVESKKDGNICTVVSGDEQGVRFAISHAMYNNKDLERLIKESVSIFDEIKKHMP